MSSLDHPIFQKVNNWNNIKSYLAYSQVYGIREYFISGSDVISPATKEQCDLLFQKMTEAGYEWDAEKKELGKIEDEEYNGDDYGIDSLFHAQRILEKTLGKVDGYQTDDGILSHKCAITAVKKLYEQKSAGWSEEDKIRLDRICKTLWKNRKGDTDEIFQQEQDVDWLKSLKDSVQPQSQPNKNEKDEEMFDYALDMIEWYSGKNENRVRLVSDWLKSLKQRLEEQQ